MATDVERLTVSLEASVAKFTKEMEKARRQADGSLAAIEKRTNDFSGRFTKSMGGLSASLRASFAGVAAAISAGEILKSAEAYTRVQNSLKVAGLQGKELASVYNELLAISMRQAAPLEQLSSLYGKVALNQGKLNATNESMLQFTETVALALRVQGTSAQEAAGALQQLGQALGGDVVRAEEFNSILEGSPALLRAAAAGLKEAGGDVSKLRQLMLDGKLVSAAFFDAIIRGQSVLASQAGRTQATVGQAYERMQTSFINLVGKLNEASGATTGLANWMDTLARGIDKVANAVPNAVNQLQKYLKLAQEAAKAQGLDQLGNAAAKRNNVFVPDLDDNGYTTGGSFGAGSGQGGGPLPSTAAPVHRRYRINPVSLNDYGGGTGGTGGGGGGGGGSRGGGGGGVNPIDSQIQSLERSRAAIEAEYAALGKSNAERQVAIALAEAGAKATDAQKASITGHVTAIQTAEDAIKAYEDAQRRAQQAAQEFGDAAANAFADVALEGKNAGEVIRGLVMQLARSSITNFLGGPSGLFTNMASGFSPGRAGGGQVSAGRPYTVGEFGRETFVPTTPGKIVPNGSRGGGTVNHSPVYNITAAPGMDVRQVAAIVDAKQQQFATRLPALLRRADQRGF